MSLIDYNQMNTLTQAEANKLQRGILIENWSKFGETKAEKDGVIKSTGKAVKKDEVIVEGVNMLEGLKGIHAENMAVLLQNQLKNPILENTNSSSSGSYQVMQFSMVKRIFSRLLANELVSVQAMTAPTGTIFYYYPTISDRVATVDQLGNPVMAHTPTSNGLLPQCQVSGANCPATTFSGCQSLYDRYYNENLFDHSKGSYTLITATGSPIMFQDGCVVPSTGLTIGNDGSIRQALFGVSGFDGNNPGTGKGHNARLSGVGGRGLEIDTNEFLATLSAINVGAPILDPYGNVIYETGDPILYRLGTQAYGSKLVEYRDLCDDNGVLHIELDFVHPITNCTPCPTVDGHVGAVSGLTINPADIAFAWRRYDDLEYSSEMGEVSFEIKQKTITVQTRKLRAKWSPELTQDLNAFHSLDAEQELTALMSEHIAMEIDRQIIRELKNAAPYKRHWDYFGWKQQGSQKYTQKEWNQTLITEINRISAQIHKATLRGGANFVVVSTEVSAVLDDIEHFAVSNVNLEQDTYNMGMRRAGTLAGRYTVYVDPYARPYEILIGHKGTSSMLDTGYVFAPYLPITLTDSIPDPNTGTRVKFIQSRYATDVVNNKYYGVIYCNNLITFNPNEFR